MDFTVVLPAYNEEKRISKTLKRIRQHSKSIIVVDDGSSDRTSEVAEKEGATVIRFDENIGKGAAVIAGIIEAPTEAVVLIDADNQFSADEIPVLLRELKSHDLVLGNRFSAPQKNSFPAYRLMANKLIQSIVRLRCGVSDPLTGFRALRKSRFTGLREKGFNTDLEMVFYAWRNGYSIKEAPVSVSYSLNEESKFANPLSVTAITEYLKLFSYALRNVF